MQLNNYEPFMLQKKTTIILKQKDYQLMKKIIAMPLAICTIALISACATVKTGNDFSKQPIVLDNTKAIAQINANNYGYYLFSFIPIITGNPRNANSFSLFKNQVTVGKVTEMLTRRSKILGGKRTINMQSTILWTGRFSLWIFWLKEVQVSGNAMY